MAKHLWQATPDHALAEAAKHMLEECPEARMPPSLDDPSYEGDHGYYYCPPAELDSGLGCYLLYPQGADVILGRFLPYADVVFRTIGKKAFRKVFRMGTIIKLENYLWNMALDRGQPGSPGRQHRPLITVSQCYWKLVTPGWPDVERTILDERIMGWNGGVIKALLTQALCPTNSTASFWSRGVKAVRTDLLPILADALEEAGVENKQLLAGLRAGDASYLYLIVGLPEEWESRPSEVLGWGYSDAYNLGSWARHSRPRRLSPIY